jgi:glycosyltransferase involved in cell wall biosynthesis
MINRTLHIALPVLGESSTLPNFLKCIEKQSFKKYKLYVCVNQYESWWDKEKKIHYCIDNEKSISFLKSSKIEIEILDKSSQGLGWPDNKGGVGWARKTLMDHISEADKNDIIVSMDADTYYPDNYLLSIATYFNKKPEHMALSLPYYHQLEGNDSDRFILRYEMYMRYYALNMLRIQNPYHFTSLGSAIALPVWVYHKIGGMTPAKSGEDFYLLQKIVKNGPIGSWTNTIAFPASRYSDRVLFGTGPALIKGAKGNWESYPFYSPDTFDLIKETYELFPMLFKKDVLTPMSEFLSSQFKTKQIWGPLRNNYKDQSNFVKACVIKVDGLRILQFLRYSRSKLEPIADENVLKEFMQTNFANEMDSGISKILNRLDFSHSDINELNALRNFIFEKEMEFRKSFI